MVHLFLLEVVMCVVLSVMLFFDWLLLYVVLSHHDVK